jgi:hypothetical protein
MALAGFERPTLAGFGAPRDSLLGARATEVF